MGKSGNPKQVHIRITKALPGILETLQHNGVDIRSFGFDNKNKTILWQELPKEVDPSGGGLFVYVHALRLR